MIESVRLVASEPQVFKLSHPYENLLLDLFKEANAQKASDVHFDPHEFGLVVRYRINGELHVLRELDMSHKRFFLSRAKQFFGFSIDVSGKAQDSRLTLSNLGIDLRCSLLPSQFGDAIVVRILERDREFSLERVLCDTLTLHSLRSAIKAPNGIIVLSGPTGSGKTTTLYSLLSEFDRTKFNVVSIEDPIEYTLKGLRQVQVSDKLSFSDALRTILRQDPDIILVGEIRDHETAELAFQASETGHLVFSTVHANNCIQVVDRLKALGICEERVYENLRLSGAQRLIKLLCQHCAKKLNGDFKARSTKGCPHCMFGISGRAAIIEFINDTWLKARTNSKNTEPAFRSLSGIALDYLKQGLIDQEECDDVA